MRRILCMLGFHKWRFVRSGKSPRYLLWTETRQCIYCERVRTLPAES